MLAKERKRRRLREHVRRPDFCRLDPATYCIFDTCRDGKRYRVRIWLMNGVRIDVGMFAVERDAQWARDEALRQHIANAESIYPWLRRGGFGVQRGDGAWEE